MATLKVRASMEQALKIINEQNLCDPRSYQTTSHYDFTDNYLNSSKYND